MLYSSRCVVKIAIVPYFSTESNEERYLLIYEVAHNGKFHITLICLELTKSYNIISS